MGDLIVMTRPTGPSRRLPPVQTGADVLFFTGVRYVRIEGDVPPTPVEVEPGARRTSKRKKSFEAPSPLTV